MRVAILGAGVAGASAALHLEALGYHAEVFDKARGVGGRISTRRHDSGQFDLGAQYFTARKQDFRAQVDTWQDHQTVASWQPAIYAYQDGQLSESPDTQTRWVGVPTMNAPIKEMLADITVHKEAKITAPVLNENGWTIPGFGDFDALVSTLPPEQAKALFPNSLLLKQLSVSMHPCLAIGLQFQSPVLTQADAVFVQDHPVTWLARDSHKPGRSQYFDTWVLHCSNQYSRDHRDDADEDLVAQALRWLEEILDVELPSMVHSTVQHWRYARPANERILSDEPIESDTGLVFAGDWLQGGRVEGAWRSGINAASALDLWWLRHD